MARRKRVEMLIIDPQNDFCDPKGALPVAGADQDAVRLADFIKRNLYAIDDIHVTMDTHKKLDVAHPMFWFDKQGRNPNPFTPIPSADLKAGVFRPFKPQLSMPPYGTLMDRMIAYTEKIENGRDPNKTYLIDPEKYTLFIWPVHCEFGKWGHNVFPPIMDALDEWEVKRYGMVDYVTKGTNPFTEHYSGMMAEVVDPQDPTTQLNTPLIQTLENADLLLVSGQALSHCVRFTLTDIINNFGKESVQKIAILADTTSPVPGFEPQAQKFINDARNIGVQIVDSTTFNI